MTELIQGLELVDNVKPLRNTIIESVRAMPSYYSGRVRKDPLKVKQFEPSVGEPREPVRGTVEVDVDQDENAYNSVNLDWMQVPR